MPEVNPIRFHDMESSTSPVGGPASAPKNPDKEVIKDPENFDKMKEKHFREEKSAIEEYCKKHNIPVGDIAQMLVKAKERMQLGQNRTAGERKPLSKRDVIVNPQNNQTIIAGQAALEAVGVAPGTTPPSLRGRVKQTSSQQETSEESR